MSKLINLTDDELEEIYGNERIKGDKRERHLRKNRKGTRQMVISGRNMLRVEKDLAYRKEKEYKERLKNELCDYES